MVERDRVDAPGGGYDTFIEGGLRKRIGARTTGFALGERVVIVSTPAPEPLSGGNLAAALLGASGTIMPDGEQYKSLDTVAKLYADFVEASLDRSGTVIALAGGVVGDTAGFAAASYMRG